MFGNMLGKLQEAQQKMAEVKERLDKVSVKGESSSGKVAVFMTGNRKVNDVKISKELFENGDNEELEDYLVMAINDALEKVDKIAQEESKSSMGDILPNIPGLNL
jgi:DNA-binding YbaB/EbfC family protein